VFKLPVPVPHGGAGGRASFEPEFEGWAGLLRGTHTSRSPQHQTGGAAGGLCVLQARAAAPGLERKCLAGAEFKRALCTAISAMSVEYRAAAAVQTAGASTSIGGAFRSLRGAELDALDYWKTQLLGGC
jgi:hypothetical protein